MLCKTTARSLIIWLRLVYLLLRQLQITNLFLHCFPKHRVKSEIEHPLPKYCYKNDCRGTCAGLKSKTRKREWLIDSVYKHKTFNKSPFNTNPSQKRISQSSNHHPIRDMAALFTLWREQARQKRNPEMWLTSSVQTSTHPPPTTLGVSGRWGLKYFFYIAADDPRDKDIRAILYGYPDVGWGTPNCRSEVDKNRQSIILRRMESANKVW